MLHRMALPTALPRLLATVLAALAVAGCAGPAAGPAGRLPVVSTVTQVSALVRAVGGGRIALTALLDSRDDPHQYELRPQQVTSLGRARLVFESGAGLDRWMDRGLAAAGVRSGVVDLSRAVGLRTRAEAGTDPHWWYDTDNAKLATDAIAATLGRADPAGRDAYLAAAGSEKQRLDDTDSRIRAAVGGLPAARRLFVANHDAFNYLLARYEITLIGDVVPATDSIAAIRPAEIARLVAAIRARHVCVVFTETTIDPKLVRQISSESGATVSGGSLFGDAIGDPGSPGATLEAAILHDGTTMARGFASC